MISEILNINTDMDFVSDWIELNQYDYLNRKDVKAATLQVIWDNISGSQYDGILQIFISADGENSSLATEINIDNSSNISDSLFIALLIEINFIRFKFIQNSLSTGNLVIKLWSK